MQLFYINKKTGFENNPDDTVIIRDFRGKIFYTTKGLNKPIEGFNLPIGKYYYESGDFKPLKEPLKFPLQSLPIRERFFKENPFNFKIKFDVNKSKATILWDKRLIIFDNSLLEYTIPELYFILFHEYGHQFYTTEKYADIFAYNTMIKKGYNPSQIAKAQLLSLSHKQLPRKKYLSKIFNK